MKLRFRCTGCGRCCYGGPDHYIEVSAKEQERIRKHLGVSSSWFRRHYLVHVDPGVEGIRIGANGACVLLGKDQRCRVYPVRPTQCRRFPLWPELLESRKAWLEEARRCEGMGQGPVIPLARIKTALKKRKR